MPACLPWITLDSRDAILWGSLICGILEFWTSSERMADTRPSTRLSFRSSSPVVAGTISVRNRAGGNRAGAAQIGYDAVDPVFQCALDSASARIAASPEAGPSWRPAA
jgi:hypothetical protein